MDKFIYPIHVYVNTRDMDYDKFNGGDILKYACLKLNHILSANNINADNVINIKFNETSESIPGRGEFKQIHLIAFVKVEEDFYDSRISQK